MSTPTSSSKRRFRASQRASQLDSGMCSLSAVYLRLSRQGEFYKPLKRLVGLAGFGPATHAAGKERIPCLVTVAKRSSIAYQPCAPPC